jgi:hypothetical protein
MIRTPQAIVEKLFSLLIATTFVLTLTACSEPDVPDVATEEVVTEEVVTEEAEVDVVSEAREDSADEDWASREPPVRKIPNIPQAAEAYYAPDSFHFIAQTQDDDAQHPEDGYGGALTYIYTDDGEFSRRINDHGQDACSYFFPDQKSVVWTSTRDNMDMPLGDWAEDTDYPQGAELYISDIEGNDIRRLTDNDVYEAEVSVSPDGEWVVFGRQIDGQMDLWRMRPDGSDEQQITFTEDWQEGAPFYLPDNETIMLRAWQSSVKAENKRRDAETGERSQTPMTVFTIKHDGSDLVQRTFDDKMNWAPYPAPDGRHYVFVRIVDGNWDVFLGDLAGGEPVRLTWSPGFDGLPALSPDGTKMLFARGERGFADIYTYVMDMSAFNLGPENWTGEVPPVQAPESDGS